MGRERSFGTAMAFHLNAVTSAKFPEITLPVLFTFTQAAIKQTVEHFIFTKGPPVHAICARSATKEAKSEAGQIVLLAFVYIHSAQLDTSPSTHQNGLKLDSMIEMTWFRMRVSQDC